MKVIANTVSGIFIAGVIIVIAYKYQHQIYTVINPTLNSIETALRIKSPCSSPITYSVGSLDQKFGLSTDKLLSDAASAAEIWNTAAGKTLIHYSSDGTVPINLIYDYRQNATQEMHSLGFTIKDDKSSYDALKNTYDSLMTSYTNNKATLDQQISAYNSAKTAYEQQVNYWNARGGAPKSEYDKLEQQRQDLNTQAAQVNASEDSLNTTVDQINAAASILNRLASELNLNVKTYNSIGASTGPEFNEGEYVSDTSGQRIDIYEYENNDQLIRVLAHEMGHALGLHHVNDPKAIMYALNQSENETPTQADLTELKNVCSI